MDIQYDLITRDIKHGTRVLSGHPTFLKSRLGMSFSLSSPVESRSRGDHYFVYARRRPGWLHYRANGGGFMRRSRRAIGY